MPEKEVPIRTAPAGPLKPFMDDVRRAMQSLQERMRSQEATIVTLADLLKGTAPATASINSRTLPPVTYYEVRALPNSIEFLFTRKFIKSPGTFDQVPVSQIFPNIRTQLWRALEDETALNAIMVDSTDLLGLSDHPPPGVTYRYWLRYVCDIEERNGPLTPTEGFPYTAQEVTNPEAEFDLTSGGIFLETFEGHNVETDWVETDPATNLPTITYPPDGVVGGTVAQFAGDEAWRYHDTLIPYDPTVLYRFRVGVRYTAAPSDISKMKFYAGVQCYAADGNTLLNILGANAFGNQHYVAASGADLIGGGINNWQTFTGYFSGLGVPGPSPAPNVYAPSALFSGTKFFTPVFVVNYDDGNGTVQVDYIRIEALNPLDISLTGTLSLSSFTVPANQLNQVLSYANAGGTFDVRYGSYILTGTGAVAYSIAANPNALTASIHSTSGVFSITGGMSDALDTATITFRATYGSVTIDRVFTITKAVEGGFDWTPVVDIDSGAAQMVIDGATIQKVGGVSAWDSSVYSVEAFASGAVVTFRPAQNNKNVMVGLNGDPLTDANYTSIDYAWYVRDVGICNIFESGVDVATIGAYSAGDVFSVAHDGEKVRYFKNNVLQREVPAPGRTLGFDSSFDSPGGKIVDVRFSSQGSTAASNKFVARGNCRYAGSTIEKVGGVSAFDSDCYSTDGYTEGAFCSAQASDTVTTRLFGLNSDPTTDSHYTSIDYHWDFEQDGFCYAFEGASNVGNFGAYTTATVLAIRHIGPIVQWIKDGNVVRSAARTATTPLFFDSSFLHAGTKLLNVQFGPAGRGAEADPSAVYLETFEQPWETSFQNVANNAALVVTYPNNGQFGGKVIRAQNQLYIRSNENIPFDANALYRITTRVRRIAAGGAGTQQIYCGTYTFDSAGADITVNPWNCAQGFDMGAIAINTWQDFVGYFKGVGSNVGVAANLDSPTNLAVGAASFRPAIVLNYASGSGTMECDFIKIERLTNPSDADNSDKNRIIPDSEFALATDDTYWYRTPINVGAASTTSPVISTTGGAVAGKVTLTTSGSFSPVRRTVIVSRRRVPMQGATGQLYTATIRWRRTGSVDGGTGATYLNAGLVRHNQSPSNSSFDFSLVLFGAGGSITGPELDAGTVNQWNETSFILFLPRTSAAANAAYPYLSAYMQWLNVVARAIEVDYFSILPGVSCDPLVLEVTAGPYGLSPSEIYRKVNYNSASGGTISLPGLSDDSYVGSKIYFEQVNTGVLTIAASGANVLQSQPNTTGNRNMNGRWAKAFAECIDSNTWRLTGQLA